MVNSAEFAKRLQKILDHYGLSATAFADEVEVNRSTISHLLSGRNKPSLDFVLKVVRHYPDVGLYWLLNGKGEFPAQSESAEAPKQTRLPAQAPEEIVKDALHTPSADIERIVIFYRDGSFKSYTP